LDIGIGESLTILLVIGLGAVVIAVEVWAIIDAATRPHEAWEAIGANKALWITLIAVFAVACGIVGLVLAIVYLATIRPKLRATRF
jgi:hypothetical protein